MSNAAETLRRLRTDESWLSSCKLTGFPQNENNPCSPECSRYMPRCSEVLKNSADKEAEILCNGLEHLWEGQDPW